MVTITVYENNQHRVILWSMFLWQSGKNGWGKFERCGKKTSDKQACLLVMKVLP